MLEFYEAYSNYRDLMDMNDTLAKNITGSTIVGVELDFGRLAAAFDAEAIVKDRPEAAERRRRRGAESCGRSAGDPRATL